MSSTAYIRQFFMKRSYRISARRNFFGRLSKKPREFTINEKSEICDYLENPTKTGIWRLEFDWLNEKGLTAEIVNEYKKHEKKNNFSDIDEEFNRKTFIFSLFSYFLDKNLDNKYEDIFKKLPINRLKKKYHDAVKHFEEKIYYDGFDPKVFSSQIIKIKEGGYSYEDNISHNYDLDDEDEERYYSARFLRRNTNKEIKIQLFSTNIETLEIIQKFYELINKISNPQISRIFSPENEVFIPYLAFLNSGYKHIFSDLNLRKKFKSGIKDYSDEEFEHSVSTIGIIAEELLTEIYESLFREVCPKGLTLGELSKLINNEINKITDQPTNNPPNINELFEKISDFQAKNENLSKEKFIEVSREIIKHIQYNSKYTLSKIQEINKQNISTIFPKSIRENLAELISYRNAVSHKSTISIAAYHALRTIYCCVTLTRWWYIQKEKINWKKTKEEIVQEIIKNH